MSTTTKSSANGSSTARRRGVPRWPVVSMAAVGLTGTAVLLVLMVWSARRDPAPGILRPDLRPAREVIAMQRAGAALLGRHLGERFAGVRTLVLLPAAAQADDMDAAAEEGLTAGLAGRLDVIAVRVSPGGTDAASGSALWLQPEVFDRHVLEHPDCALVVSLVGLPVHVEQLRFWALAERPDLALFDAPVYLLGKLVANGAIDAVAMRRPWRPGDPEPGPPGEARHWLLVTQDTLAAIARQYPSLFLEEQVEHTEDIQSDDAPGSEPVSR